MDDSGNSISNSIELVALVYESLKTRNMQKLEEIVTKDVTWNVTEGFPFSGVYTGLNKVLRGFYGRVMSVLSKLDTEKVKWIDAGQNVVVLGFYLMTVKGETEEHRVRFTHTWEIEDGKVTGVWQVADTAKLPKAFQPRQ